MVGWSDVQFQGLLPNQPSLIATADGVDTTITKSNIPESDAVSINPEAFCSSLAGFISQHVFSIFSQWRIRRDSEMDGRRLTNSSFQVVRIQQVLGGGGGGGGLCKKIKLKITVLRAIQAYSPLYQHLASGGSGLDLPARSQ